MISRPPWSLSRLSIDIAHVVPIRIHHWIPGGTLTAFPPVPAESIHASRYRAAWKTDEFRASAAQRWKQLRQHGLSSSAVLDKFDEAAALISSAAARNYKRWSSVIFSQGFDNGMAQWEYYVSDMRQWIEARLAWMDSALEEANPY